MSTKIRSIYYYAVCFVTLIICIFAMTGLVNALTDFLVPSPIYTPSKIDILRQKDGFQLQGVPQEMIQKLLLEERREQIEREKQNQRHRLVKDLIRSLTLVLIALPLYLYHWRRIRRLDQ